MSRTAAPLSPSEGSPLHDTPGSLAVLVYALAGGVLWWALHLVALSALVPAVCGDEWPRWIIDAVNVACTAGVLSSLYAARWARRLAPAAGRVNGRAEMLPLVAALFNVISLALVLLESVPVYVLDVCR